jgi:hypothetical protein
MFLETYIMLQSEHMRIDYYSITFDMLCSIVQNVAPNVIKLLKCMKFQSKLEFSII